jgi:hypothetical protein
MVYLQLQDPSSMSKILSRRRALRLISGLQPPEWRFQAVDVGLLI